MKVHNVQHSYRLVEKGRVYRNWVGKLRNVKFIGSPSTSVFSLLYFDRKMACICNCCTLLRNCLFEHINSLQVYELTRMCSPLHLNADFTINLCCTPLVCTFVNVQCTGDLSSTALFTQTHF